MSRRTWIIIGLIIAVMVVAIIVVPTVAKYTDNETSTNNVLQSNWFNYSWLYREPITINNGGSALTNYQMQLTLNLSSLISSSHMLASGNDIRFTTSDGQTPLNYWIESISTPSAAVIWVNITSIPANNSIIYMYYGNSAASASSSGDNTFIFWDDFETTPFSKWTVTNGTMNRVSTPTPVHGVYCAQLVRSSGTFSATATFSTSPTVATIVEYSEQQAQVNRLVDTEVLSSTSGIGPHLQMDASGRIRYNASVAFNPAQTYSANTWYTFKLDNIDTSTASDTYYLYLNGTAVRVTNPPAVYAVPFQTNLTNINKITFTSTVSGTFDIDLVKVRAYAATVPTLVSQGAEE